MMKQRLKDAAGILAAVIAAGLLTLGAWGMGIRFADASAGWGIAFAVSLVLLAAAAAINVVFTRRFRKNLESMTAKQLIDKGLEYKQKIESDYAEAEKKLNKLIRQAYLYLSGLILLCVFGCFSLGKLSARRDAGTALLIAIFVLFAMLLVSGFLCVVVLPAPPTVPEKKLEIRRAEYPLLYAAVLRAAEEAACKKRVRLFFGDDGFGVAEGNNEAIVNIDPEEFAFLTKEELYSVMLHEFAHVRNLDTKKSKRLYTVQEKWTKTAEDNAIRLLLLPRALFLSAFADRIAFESSAYTEISSRWRETQADALVKEKSFGQTYINATTKGMLLVLYRASPHRETTFDIYASEEPVSDYYTKDLQNFKKYLGERETLWNYILHHQIPARVDSHPTLPMRMEHMGVGEYDYGSEEEDPAYLIEQEKALRENDKTICDRLRPYYMRNRSEYLKLCGRMEEYDKAEAEGKEFTPAELAEYAGVFFELDDDKSLALCDRLLRADPDSDFAAYYKGMILARWGREEGIPLLYKAARANFNLAEAAMEQVGRFALNMGREDILEEYRASFAEVMQNSMDRESDTTLSRGDKLFKSDIPEEIFAPVRKEIVALGKKKVVRIYLVKKTGKDGQPAFLYAVELRNVTSHEEAFEIMDCIFRYLQNSGLPEKYRRFGLYNVSSRDKTLKRFLKAVPDCKIYDAALASRKTAAGEKSGDEKAKR